MRGKKSPSRGDGQETKVLLENWGPDDDGEFALWILNNFICNILLASLSKFVEPSADRITVN